MKRIAAFLFAIALVVTTSAHGAKWTVDKVHSKVGFAVKHLMISTVRGEFKSYDATIQFDPQKPENLSIQATLDVNSISTENEQRDGHLKSADFFDAENHPTITFTSKKVEKTGDGKFKVTGDLMIRGTTKEVTFDLEGLNQMVEMGGVTKTAATATASINRQDFGLSWSRALETGGLVVDNTVMIVVEAELDMQK
ncbi:YceI family protein [bacterium]|nr:YceI family protein [bacterium]MBU1983143.1 YceI family protein [bacterium]